MNNVSRLVDTYNYVAMDTEFPGFISHSTQIQDSSIPDHHRLYTKENVDELKVIQVGITLQNEKGEYPTGRGRGGSTSSSTRRTTSRPTSRSSC